MSYRPRVSVVIPTRDRKQLLERALRRVAEQSYDGEIECIVVFDQSDPDLPDVPEREGLSIRAIRNTRTPGLAGGRNSGAAEATGELLAFCDDDDEWLPEKLSLQVAVLGRNPDVSTVASGIEVHYEDKTFPRISPEDEVTFEELLASRRTDVHPSTFLVRLEDFRGRIGPVDEHLPGSYAEDYEWLLRAARVSPIRALRLPLVKVHWHRSSYFSERWQTIASALSYLLERYPEFRESNDGWARISGQIAFAYGAAGEPRAARQWARRTFEANWREPRVYLALAVSAGVPAKHVLRLAHLAGKGI